MEKIIVYLENNMEETQEIVGELNSWNGSFDFLEFHENDEYFFETFFGDNITGAVRSAIMGDYHFSDPFVRFDGIGNLESFSSEKQVQDEIMHYIEDIAEVLIDEWHNIDINNDELENLVIEYLTRNE